MAAERVLVTGGAGFIGSNLTRRLLADGARVICLDDFSTGAVANLADVAGDPGLTILTADVALPIDAACDRIFNLASPASPVQFRRDPVATTRTNVLGALNVLELARRNGARALQASTAEVYGDPEVHPQTEAYWGAVNPIGPRACYDEAKRCAESLFMDYRRQYGVAVKVARIFNTYGPGMAPDDGRVVSEFIVSALSNRPVTVHGGGSQTRSFCYVDDMVDGLMRLMAAPEDVTGPINLGNPEEISIAELASLVIDLTGSASTVALGAPAENDPRRRRPAIDLAAATLDWRPVTSLREGLTQTIAHFEMRLRAPAPA